MADSHKREEFLPRFPPLHLLSASLLVVVGAPFHYGCQMLLTNPSEETFLRFVNRSISAHYALRLDRQRTEAIWSATVALFFAGAVPGSLFINQVADRLGRKPGILASNAAIAVCTALESAAYFLNSIELFAFVRFSLGFWVIIGTGVSSVYLTECSPKFCRGAIGTMTGLCLQVGTIAAAITGTPRVLGSDHQWWLIFALEAAAQLCLLPLLGFVLHESPSFLLFHGREKEARRSIQTFYGATSQIEDAVKEIGEECKAQADSQGMLDVWRDPSRTTRRGLRVAVVLGLCLSFCGVAVVDAYVVGILRSLGFSALNASVANVGIAVGGLLFALLSTCLVDHFGRRPLMLASFAAMIVTNICISALMYANAHEQSELVRILILAAITCFLLGFEFGFGSLFYFVVTEMVGQSGRSAAQGWMKLVDTSSRSVVLALYLPLRDLIGNGQTYALLFLPILCCSAVFLFFAMPETKNRNLAEVEAQLDSLPTAQLFAKWRTMKRVNKGADIEK